MLQTQFLLNGATRGVLCRRVKGRGNKTDENRKRFLPWLNSYSNFIDCVKVGGWYSAFPLCGAPRAFRLRHWSNLMRFSFFSSFFTTLILFDWVFLFSLDCRWKLLLPNATACLHPTLFQRPGLKERRRRSEKRSLAFDVYDNNPEKGKLVFRYSILIIFLVLLNFFLFNYKNYVVS